MSGSRELKIAIWLILLITLGYLGLVWRFGLLGAGSRYGRALGSVGFLLMLMTEMLYSTRKRAVHRPWGRLASWLRFHIITGIVGPYLVFLHSDWSFRGLAGTVLLLTFLVVVSGFIGRYIYTAVPRNADGLVVELEDLQREILEIEMMIRRVKSVRTPPGAWRAVSVGNGASLVWLRALDDWSARLAAWWRGRGLPGAAHGEYRERESLIRRRRKLARQLSTLATARRMLAVWRAIHVPLGLALFIAAFFHIFAAIYFAGAPE
jgi:hypothetical protein